MKYRRLTKEELPELEKEFINFLSVNGITGPDWEKIKKERPTEADQHVDVFSDMVFEKVLKDVHYLEFRTPNDLKVFHCLKDKIVMMGIFIDGPSELDFTQKQGHEEMIAAMKKANAQIKLYQAEKTYSKERALELFDMMENGCLIAKKEIFEMLENLRGE